jgi:uncharacterized protein (TIGR03083 family)
VLDDLSAEQWAERSLCTEWSVEEVVAHLSAAANTGRWAWFRSIVRSGFDPAKHNARLLSRYRGRSPAETVEIFREAVTATIAPTKDFPAFLGEVVVHGQGIARPLGIELSPEPEAVESVARYYVAKDFAVKAKQWPRDCDCEQTMRTSRPVPARWSWVGCSTSSWRWQGARIHDSVGFAS